MMILTFAPVENGKNSFPPLVLLAGPNNQIDRKQIDKRKIKFNLLGVGTPHTCETLHT